LALRVVRHPGHAGELGLAVDLHAAGAALAGLAVPPAREVARVLQLGAVDEVEHDHARVDLDPVLDELAAVLVAAPDAEVALSHWTPPAPPGTRRRSSPAPAGPRGARASRRPCRRPDPCR